MGKYFFLTLVLIVGCHRNAPSPDRPAAPDTAAVQPIPPAPQVSPPSAATAAVLNAHGEQINACFQTKAQMGLLANGDVTLRWQVNAQGAVENASVYDSTAHNEHLESCLLKAVRSWQYPPPDEGKSLTLLHTFVAP